MLVQTVADVAALAPPDPTRVSYLAQTTLAVDETVAIIAALRARFPHARGPGTDDIRYATTNRQRALATIADEADLVLVVGSANSSNSSCLLELARRRGTPARLIEDASEIEPGWLAGARVVGLTAGASAPPPLVDDVLAALRRYGPLVVTEREVAREDIRFTAPTLTRRAPE